VKDGAANTWHAAAGRATDCIVTDAAVVGLTLRESDRLHAIDSLSRSGQNIDRELIEPLVRQLLLQNGVLVEVVRE
jgi:hypothetical protein